MRQLCLPEDKMEFGSEEADSTYYVYKDGLLAQCAKDKVAVLNLYSDQVTWLTWPASEQNLVNGQFLITETHFIAWTAGHTLYLWKIKSSATASPLRFDFDTTMHVLGLSYGQLIMLAHNQWVFCDIRTGCISTQPYCPPYEDLVLRSFALANDFAYIYLEADENGGVSQFLCIFSIHHEPHLELKCHEIVDICSLNRAEDGGAMLTFQHQVMDMCCDLDGFYWHKWIWYELTHGRMIKRYVWEHAVDFNMAERICHPEWLASWFLKIIRTPQGAYFALEQRVGSTRSVVSGPEFADIAQAIDDMHIALNVTYNGSGLGQSACPYCSRADIVGDRDFAIIVHENCSMMEIRRFYALANEL